MKWLVRSLLYLVFLVIVLGLSMMLFGIWSGLTVSAFPLSFGTYLILGHWVKKDRAAEGVQKTAEGQ